MPLNPEQIADEKRQVQSDAAQAAVVLQRKYLQLLDEEGDIEDLRKYMQLVYSNLGWTETQIKDPNAGVQRVSIRINLTPQQERAGLENVIDVEADILVPSPHLQNYATINSDLDLDD